MLDDRVGAEKRHEAGERTLESSDVPLIFLDELPPAGVAGCVMISALQR